MERCGIEKESRRKEINFIYDRNMVTQQTCFLCKKKFGWIDDKFGKTALSNSNIPIPEGFGMEDMLCYKCFKSEEDRLNKPVQQPFKSQTEFLATYVGGHILYPKLRKGVVVSVLHDKLSVSDVNIEIPFTSITKIENGDEKKIAALRVVLLGVVGALWKKKHVYTIIQFKDELQNEQTMIFDFEDQIEIVQPLIYNKVLEVRKKNMD